MMQECLKIGLCCAVSAAQGISGAIVLNPAQAPWGAFWSVWHEPHRFGGNGGIVAGSGCDG